jgi:hypothetical protein
VGCECPTGENAYVPTWGNTSFAALPLQSTTTALKRPHTRAPVTDFSENRRAADGKIAICHVTHVRKAGFRTPPQLQCKSMRVKRRHAHVRDQNL